MRLQDLDCDVAIEPGIIGTKHLAETAISQPLSQLEPAQSAE